MPVVALVVVVAIVEGVLRIQMMVHFARMFVRQRYAFMFFSLAAMVVLMEAKMNIKGVHYIG